ncbi:helix-turn-helix transcriptional regulator [bacterium]|nr:helix-turn-helix transcriptional regulator [bacterium]
MPDKIYCALDRDRIRQILQTQSLKRWWVAECTGVHKTTLRRWLSGRIARVEQGHLRSLASVLEVQEQEIGKIYR